MSHTKDFVIIFILLTMMIGFTGYIFYKNYNNKPVIVDQKTFTLHVGKLYKIEQIQVRNGCVYDILLENNKRYLVELDNAQSPEETKDVVIRHFSEQRQKGNILYVLPHKHNGDHWLVDIVEKDKDGKMDSLTKWLESQSLLYAK